MKLIIKSYSRFLAKYLTVEQIKFSFISMPVKTKKLTLQRSPHVYKKARATVSTFNV
jgi:ribosomal protein S10